MKVLILVSLDLNKYCELCNYIDDMELVLMRRNFNE